MQLPLAAVRAQFKLARRGEVHDEIHAALRQARDNHTQVLQALRRRDPVAAGDAVRSDPADAADVILASDQFVLEKDSVNVKAA